MFASGKIEIVGKEKVEIKEPMGSERLTFE
jgi:hypothetical protein